LTLKILQRAETIDLAVLFSPEHGFRGAADAKVNSGLDSDSGLPVHSLYGAHRKPTPAMLAGLEALVFDIQDIGTRFYTYIGTMSLAMEAARENGLKFVVLDRPNPIAGIEVGGAIPPSDLCGGLTSIHPIPTRHGMTVGELALLFNDHFGIGCDLEVIPMQGWKREMFYEETGLPWIPPSPNMKTHLGAFLYPGVGVCEATTLSCARGTEIPFEVYGAPYLDAGEVVANLSARNIPGVAFQATTFTPTAEGHKFEGELCHGVRIAVDDRKKADPFLIGLHFIQAVYETHPKDFIDLKPFLTLTGDPNLWENLTKDGKTPETILAGWEGDLEEFKRIRARYLLYE
jgi:uncharacterized protein YbbC (DUF1343 family)